MTTEQKKAEWLALKNSLISIAGECLLEKKEEIVGLVIDQQQNKSEDSLGNPLRAYSAPYRIHKELMGKSGITDFDLTGEMHGTMDLSVQDEEYFINSPARTDTGQLKSEWLMDWQNAPVMDLTAENKQIAYQIIEPIFLEKAKEVLD